MLKRKAAARTKRDGENARQREKRIQASGAAKQSDIDSAMAYDFDCVILTLLPLTCRVVIDGAVISRLNICNEILLFLLDLAMGSLSPSQL